MASVHICPHCGGKRFSTTAQIVQEWIVDERGNFISVETDRLEVTSEPDDANIWLCTQCGYEGVIKCDVEH